MLRVAFFYLLLASVVVLAIWRGQRDERLAAVTCVIGTALTVHAGDALPIRFSNFDHLAFIVDVGVFFAFLAIALRSERYWPLWVAGLQLTAISIHPMMIISPDMSAKVFGVGLAFWSYPILILIAVGSWRTQLVGRWRVADDIASRQAIT